MIECYYHWCEDHSKDEPFCNNSGCRATNTQLIKFRKLREKDLIRYEAKDHFKNNGDKVKAKTKSTAHASYDVLRGSLTRYAYPRVGRDWQDAEDVVQDAYVRTLETAKVNEFFNFGALYKIWLDRSIRDKNKDRKRAGEVFTENDEVEGTGGLTIIDISENTDAYPPLLLEVQDRLEEVLELSSSLKSKSKSIIRLILIFGYSYKEVAHMLDVDIKRVDNTLAHFRKRLKV